MSEADLRKLIRTKKYLKSLKALPERDRRMVDATVSELEGNWNGLDIKHLEGFERLWRLRAGSYRVLCEIKRDGSIQLISALNVKRRTSTTYH